MLYKSVFILFLTCLSQVTGSKILMIWAMPAHSHYTVGISLAKGLADKGHQITFMSPYPQKNPHKNIKDIVVEEPIPFLTELNKNLLDLDKVSAIGNLKAALTMGVEITRLFFQNKDVQRVIKTKESFDVIISELFVNEAVIGLSYQLKAPIILVVASDSTLYPHLFGNPLEMSYIPNKAGTLTSDMDFWQRFQNMITTNIFNLIRELYIMPKQRQIFNEYVTNEIELDDVLYNASLMLTNSHFSIGISQPLLPNIIDVGGYHVSPPKKLQKFLDDAKDGVVIFSMGSNLKSADLKPEVQDAIMKSFKKIKQKVLWKFEKDLPDLPDNVKIMKWLPQNDVLAHPNVVAFISHGGLLGTIEAVSNGVPIIGIPVFGDQKNNIAAAAAQGYALSVPLSEITEERLSHALNEILNNPKYREAARFRSKIWHDRPMNPMETAIYWVEYVIRYQGAPHLRSPALNLKWYQRNMLDIIIVLTLITVILFVIFYFIIKHILGALFRTKSQNSEKTTVKTKKRAKKD